MCAGGKQRPGANANVQCQRAAVHLQCIHLVWKFNPQQETGSRHVNARAGREACLDARNDGTNPFCDAPL
ncbi:hypothetical protein NMCA_25810 [Enterobacter ludwigii]|nr:hypothetical protein NMCA_25810 [Enterobacter ludwigii]